ncbi:MAG: ORF6N domain-containing protein, partial [Eubacterium sp.]|nr:ORF6N domain-containing protein [Eubacterium sp.]
MANTKDKTEIIPVIIQTNDIGRLIYTIREKQIMLDYDLAALYGYEVKRLNEQVKRNVGRFPDDFMFQLTKEEVELVKSQIATSPDSNFYSGQEGGRRKPPYAFTEQGIYMLATV